MQTSFTGWLSLVVLALLSLAACQTDAPPPPTAVEIAAPVITLPTATPLPAVKAPPMVKADFRLAPPTPTALPTVALTNIPPTAVATPTPGLIPVTTPAAPTGEHYWLRRPVPVDYPAWTIKAYPYGGTRGGALRPHHGVEFPVGYGAPILAAGEGVVVVAGNDSAEIYGPTPDFYGNLVVIEHDLRYNDQPLYTLYAHLSQVSVSSGQRVTPETVIGLSGATGVADGSHLHFEVRIGRNDYLSTRNPVLWLVPFTDWGTVAGRVTYADGSLATETPVSLRRLDGSSKYHATTTYAAETLNPDDDRGENFALDDIEAGHYEVSAQIGERRYTAETWVIAGQTSFVTIRVGP